MGMVSRYRLQDIFLQRYGRELWGKRPVSELMNPAPLLIPLSMSIEDAAARVTAHVQYPITEDFIFVDQNGDYAGIGIVLDLLEAMSSDLGRNRRALIRAQRITGLASWEWSAIDKTFIWSSQSHGILDIDQTLNDGTFEQFIQVFEPTSQLELRNFFSSDQDCEPKTLELKICDNQPEARYIEFHGEHFHDGENGEHRAVGTLRDITQRRLTEQRLAQLANYDHLTGLPNRYLFQDRLRHAIAQADRSGRLVALLFLDIDRFKWINDALGHAAGDHLLEQVAQRLSGALRGSDTVARLGGDEFTIILENIETSHQVRSAVSQILNCFSQKFRLGHRDIAVSTSVGVAFYPDDAKDLDSLLKCADAAMYSAKDRGRDGYHFYTAELNQQADRRFQLEHGLRSALDRNEFSLVYQPQVCTRTGQLYGAEALLRWCTEGDNVSPMEFVPLLEDLRLILPVGRWVLLQACAAAAKWQHGALAGVRVAVNLSVHQLRQSDFVSMVNDLLSEVGLRPDLLEVEVTESVLLDDRGANATLLALNELGVRVAIDDFGTGYSSLAYLKRLSVDTLKLDRAFVKDLTLDPDDDAIASAVISLAHALDITVTAEGVETERQIDFLRGRQCDHLQGFLIGRPMTEAAFLRWTQEHSKLPTPPES